MLLSTCKHLNSKSIEIVKKITPYIDGQLASWGIKTNIIHTILKHDVKDSHLKSFLNALIKKGNPTIEQLMETLKYLYYSDLYFQYASAYDPADYLVKIVPYLHGV